MRVDGADWSRERGFWAGVLSRSRNVLWNSVRRVSFEVERRVKLAMPVDTGRARASWGHSSPPAGTGDGIWEEDRANLSITQGSRVEYIEALNEGHSRQAPAGFIDAIESEGEELLESLIIQELGL